MRSPKQAADPAPGAPAAIQAAALPGLYHPDFIPPEPVDYGGHRAEVDAFVDSVSQMNRAEAARVHRQGIASGANMSPRWADVTDKLVQAAAQHGLEIGRVAAQHRADKAMRTSVGRAGNENVVADYCARVWAEVLVLRDHLERDVIATAFEPWDGVLEPADWMASQQPRAPG